SDHEALLFCSSSKSTWYGFLGYDGLHLNRRGNHHLSNLFYDVLKSFISLENASEKHALDKLLHLLFLPAIKQ
ncbi:unnamed protein product, partial [Larinioides sclopetarius]